MTTKEITLGEFIAQNQSLLPHSTGDLSKLLSSIKLAAKKVHYFINRAGLEKIFGLTGNINTQGEEQARLDLLANDILTSSLKSRGEVCGIASEEMEDFMVFDDFLHRKSKYIVLFDPLDGSKNIDVNVSVGTIFSIYKRRSLDTPLGLDDFLQKGREQVAAGYVLYGSSTILVLTCGNGVNGFTLDPNIGSFFLTHPNIKIPKTGNLYSVNEGNYAHFPKGIKKLLKHYQKDNPSKKFPYTSRYIGTLVSDFHRNMLNGGIYLYPQGTLYPQGKLRLMYECNPMAFITEQAGGLAINGKDNILDIKPKELHQRVPFFVGSEELVKEVKTFISNG